MKKVYWFLLGSACFIFSQPLLRLPILAKLQQSTGFMLAYTLNPPVHCCPAQQARLWTWSGGRQRGLHGAASPWWAPPARRALAPGGIWLAMKGKHPVAEIGALPGGVAVFHVEPLQVPGLAAERCIVWLRDAGAATSTLA